MSFPLSPSNGQYAVVNNIGYTYNSTTNAWTRAGTTGTTILVTSATFINGGATGSIPYQIAAGQTGFIGIATTSGWVLTSNGTTSSFAPATGGGGTSIAIVNNKTDTSLQYLTFASTTTGTLSTLQTAGPNGLVYQPSTGFYGVGTTGTLVSPLHVALAYAGPVAEGVSPTPFVALTLDNPGNVASASVAMDFRTFYPGYGNAGYTTSTIMYDFQGGGLGVNGVNGTGPSKGPGSWGMNYVSGRSGFAHHWFRDIDYNIQFSVVNNGTIATGYVAQSYDFTPQYSALIQGNIGIGTTVTNARLTVAGGATMTGIFTATSGATASNTQTGAIITQGGIGVGGTVQANQIVATNLSGAASTTIDSKVANGNYSLNFLARVVAGNYNPLVQQDDSLIYWTNNSQGFGNLVIAPWSSTSTGIRITNTGSVFIPSTNIATTPTSAALVVSGGMYTGGLSWINGGSDTQYRAAGLTVSANIGNNYTIGADPGDSNRTLSLIATTASRPIVLTFRNTQNNAASMWDFVSDPNTSKFYIQPSQSGYYVMSLSTTGTVFINSNTNAISTNSGALVINGGVGVGGDSYVGGSLSAGVTGIGSFTPRSTFNIHKSYVNAGIAEASTATWTTDNGSNTWALGQISGYVAAGYLNSVSAFPGGLLFKTKSPDGQATTPGTIRMALDAFGNLLLGTTSNATTTGTSNLIVAGAAASTSTTTGAVQVVGGVGIGGSVYVGNRVGFVSTVTNASAVYQIYNSITNSFDTVFG